MGFHSGGEGEGMDRWYGRARMPEVLEGLLAGSVFSYLDDVTF